MDIKYWTGFFNAVWCIFITFVVFAESGVKLSPISFLFCFMAFFLLMVIIYLIVDLFFYLLGLIKESKGRDDEG